MSLNASLNIGISAIGAFTAAIQNTSNNIANASTPGYTREIATFQEATSGSGAGEGVVLEGFQSVRAELLQGQMQQQTQVQSKAGAQTASLQQIQAAFTTSTQDIGTQMSALFSSLSSLSANPSSASLRQGVLSAGQNLAAAFNTTSASISEQQAASDNQVPTDVSQINSLTSQIAALNPQIAALHASGPTGSTAGGTLQDRQDQLLLSLSSLTDIAVTRTADGNTITTSAGAPLVVGSQSFALASTAVSGQQHVLDANGNDITSSLTGGDLGGNIQMRDQVLSTLSTRLNNLASQFGSAINSAQSQGFDQNGNVGQALFTNTASAATIAFATQDPTLIAASSDGSAGSNGNLANLAAVQTAALPSRQSPTNTYADLVYSVGSLAANSSAQANAGAASLLQLTNQNNAVSGVSVDEESVNLVSLQQAYSAAARVVTTIQALFQVTLSMGTP